MIYQKHTLVSITSKMECYEVGKQTVVAGQLLITVFC